MSSSLSQPKYQIKNESISDQKESRLHSRDNPSNNINDINSTICTLIDIINDNNLNIYYQDYPSDSKCADISNKTGNFKQNIDQLNLKFYLETEKILSTPSTAAIENNKLFLILFKQINLYIKEIERLNTIIIDKGSDSTSLSKRMEIIKKQREDFDTKELKIQAWKASVTSLEKRLGEVILRENKWKEENEKLRNELMYYKSTRDDSDPIRKSNRALSDINNSFNYNGHYFTSKSGNNKWKIVKTFKSTKAQNESTICKTSRIISNCIKSPRNRNQVSLEKNKDSSNNEELVFDFKDNIKGNKADKSISIINLASTKNKGWIYTNWSNRALSKARNVNEIEENKSKEVKVVNFHWEDIMKKPNFIITHIEENNKGNADRFQQNITPQFQTIPMSYHWHETGSRLNKL